MPTDPRLADFYRWTAFEELGSTNDAALARAAAGAAEGELITAARQVAGRGRRGRTWLSPEGNLHLSLVLTPPGGMAGAAAVGFAAALAVADALDRVAPGAAPVELKWPNDVLAGGAKVSGLLIETVPARPEALVLGVGVNVAHHPADTPYPATSLRVHASRATVADVLGAFCDAFLARYGDLKRHGFAPLRAAWLARARGLGAPIRVRLEARVFDGIFRDIDAAGALVLDLGGGTVKNITAGDVFFPKGA